MNIYVFSSQHLNFWKTFEVWFILDVTPLPSCGDSRNSSKILDVEDLEQKIADNYRNKLRKVKAPAAVKLYLSRILETTIFY